MPSGVYKRTKKAKENIGNANKRRLPRGEAGLSSVYSSYKERARVRKIDFELSRRQFGVFTSSDCFYCNAPPMNVRKVKMRQKRYEGWGTYQYNGIDRVDNNRGYIIDNCVPCCKYCNTAKGSKMIEEFYEWIKRVWENSQC